MLPIRMETNSTVVVLFQGLTPQGKHLCRSLLHHIAVKEALVENNPVMAAAFKHIRNFEGKAEALGLTQFDEFRKALEHSLARLVA
jgi:hypothetical protein